MVSRRWSAVDSNQGYQSVGTSHDQSRKSIYWARVQDKTWWDVSDRRLLPPTCIGTLAYHSFSGALSTSYHWSAIPLTAGSGVSQSVLFYQTSSAENVNLYRWIGCQNRWFCYYSTYSYFIKLKSKQIVIGSAYNLSTQTPHARRAFLISFCIHTVQDRAVPCLSITAEDQIGDVIKLKFV